MNATGPFTHLEIVVTSARIEEHSDVLTAMHALDGRVIIVTGAAQGIGQAAADLLLALGAAVVVVDVNQPALEAWRGLANEFLASRLSF